MGQLVGKTNALENFHRIMFSENALIEHRSSIMGEQCLLNFLAANLFHLPTNSIALVTTKMSFNLS